MMKLGSRLSAHHKQRALFVAFNAAALMTMAFTLAVVDDYMDRQALEIAEQQNLLARLESVIAREGDVRSANERVTAQLAAGDFLNGANEGIIAAELQIRLKGIIERNGARVLTMQGLNSPADQTLRYVGARVALVGTHAQIQRTVQEIETGKPYLVVRNASMRLAPAPSQAAGEPMLDVHLDVAGALPKS